MNIFVDENIEERYAEGLYEDFIFEEYEKIIFDYLANNCKDFDDEHIQNLVDLKVKQFFKLRQQIQELTNNWNELEEYLIHEIEEWNDEEDNWIKAQVYEDKAILNKMKEIKEGKEC